MAALYQWVGHCRQRCHILQMALTGAAFSQCTACSPAVVGALRDGGWPWLLSALRVRAPHTIA
jgi:hypothetical protein